MRCRSHSTHVANIVKRSLEWATLFMLPTLTSLIESATSMPIRAGKGIGRSISIVCQQGIEGASRRDLL